MFVFGSQMHVVTSIFTILEIVLFFYQYIYYLSRPQDKGRFWYLILLALLIVYNITGGLFPDPNIALPVVTQNIIAYGSGFLMASYFPYYFYKGFDLRSLRFHAIYGVPLFLILPYLIFFVVVYSINKNLDLAIQYGIVIPFFYSIVVLWAIAKAIRLKYSERSTSHDTMEMVAVYFAVLPWASMTILAYFHASQLIEVLFTNGGFIIITILFISKSISIAKMEYQLLIDKTTYDSTPAFSENCAKYQLTKREIEIVDLIRQGFKYKAIGEQLFISERTVTTHVQNVFEKTGVSNKVELIRKLESQTPPLKRAYISPSSAKE